MMFNFVYKDLDFAHKLDEHPKGAPDYQKHFHDFYELFYFISGSAVYTVEEEYHDLNPGDALLIQPGEHHYVNFKDDSTYERYVLKFPERILPDFVKQKFADRSAFYLEAQKTGSLFSKLDGLYETFSDSGEELYLLFSNTVAETVLTLCHSVPESKPFLADNKMAPILQYINDHLSVPISIEDLCREFYFSQSYICKEFRTYMKVSIMKYIRSKKIMAAHQHITKGMKPTKVAEMYGYSDYSTFYRTYLSVMGFPPSGNKNGKDE